MKKLTFSFIIIGITLIIFSVAILILALITSNIEHENTSGFILRESIVGELTTSGKRLAVPKEIFVQPGKNQAIYIAIANKEDVPINVSITLKEMPEGKNISIRQSMNTNASGYSFAAVNSQEVIEPAQYTVYSMMIIAGKHISGKKMFEVIISSNESIYASGNFSVSFKKELNYPKLRDHFIVFFVIYSWLPILASLLILVFLRFNPDNLKKKLQVTILLFCLFVLVTISILFIEISKVSFFWAIK